MKQDAQRSGLFQCQTCGLVWFGRSDIQECPDAPHGKPVHVALLCRTCDAIVPIDHLASHIKGELHQNGISN